LTAVEWLYNNLKSYFEHDGDLLEVVQFSFEQSKAQEKEQIMNSWVSGVTSDGNMTAEKYYNKTYTEE
jgi:hypothetical protein